MRLLINANWHTIYAHNVLKLKDQIRENKPNLLLWMKNSFCCEAHLWMCFVSARFSRWPVSIHVTPMSPQTQEVPADPVWHHRRSPSNEPTSVPSECQRIPDCHGCDPEDCQEAGQLLQRDYLHQQVHSSVWTSPPQGIILKILRGSAQSIIDLFFSLKLWTKDLTSYVILI